MRQHLALLTVAVHFREKCSIAEPARVGIDGRRLLQRAARIRDAKLIEDRRVAKQLLETLAVGTLEYRHNRAIAPV
jgi:hypothetical protein